MKTHWKYNWKLGRWDQLFRAKIGMWGYTFEAVW